ncbi:pilus assembly protein TadG-related protein [Actinomyces oris]|uniref:Pilus assembly protein TadG-related protein n=1 Tax=Actinomyces oris TaxID=544580 RepID=A0AAW9KSM1_9ACTO|nr:pilus assembly protein TadG-related protein [Actinomyces oris]MEA1303542.1 pilus assembly protein TadG-related protein [Actinomyces oris]
MSRFLRTSTRFPSGPKTTERGSILPYVSVGVALVALVAVTLMTALGDAILHRRDASNAADAAALAAARVWADSIESNYGRSVNATSEDGLWKNAGKEIGYFASPGAKRAAERYASLDGAALTAYSVDTVRGTVTVSVRTKSSVTGTNEQLTATSTAKIEFEDGACLTDGRVGFKIDGKCLTRHPQNKSSDQKNNAKPTPHTGAKKAPFKTPEGMQKKARISTHLVAT